MNLIEKPLLKIVKSKNKSQCPRIFGESPLSHMTRCPLWDYTTEGRNDCWGVSPSQYGFITPNKIASYEWVSLVRSADTEKQRNF